MLNEGVVIILGSDNMYDVQLLFKGHLIKSMYLHSTTFPIGQFNFVVIPTPTTLIASNFSAFYTDISCIEVTFTLNVTFVAFLDNNCTS